MTFGAQEATKKRHATSGEKALNIAFMILVFEKATMDMNITQSE